MGKYRKIKYTKERVVMSDILPYETPITYSNRHFYNFLVANKIELSNGILSWKKSNDEFDELIGIIFNVDIKNAKPENGINKLDLKSKECKESLKTIPFTFKISHKNHDFRELSLIHPINQLVIIDFYNKYKELILYYCSKSPYSIRKPCRVAKLSYFNDSKHKQEREDKSETDVREVLGKSYESLKTFFVYEKFGNIYKFYESYEYQRNEKKFNKLFKFDITKCFDSIYTHSLSWALSNKEIVKENITKNNKTLGGVFDTLMQKLNYNETNGIVIGPEFSRIFAEILLQQIDFSVFSFLEGKKIMHETDYSLFRYVDDYFLFYDEESVKDKILECFKIELKKYKLSINESKSLLYEKPIITELTIAKEKIKNFLKNFIDLKIEDIEINNKAKKYSIYFNSKSAIINFKIIIKESGIKYNDVLNYTLAIIYKKIFNVIEKYDKAIFENSLKEDKFKTTFIKTLFELIDFLMFIYSVLPQVNTTIKICSILNKIIQFLKDKTESDSKNKYFNEDRKNLVFKKISDDISLVLKKNKNSKYKQIETLYLLIVISSLGKEYRLSENALAIYLNIKKIKENNLVEYQFENDLNYWSISVILFHIRNIKIYDGIRLALINYILEKYKSHNKESIKKSAEMTILSFDLLSCPFLEKTEKIKILNSLIPIKMTNDKKIKLIKEIEKTDSWFTKWNNFNFEKELNTKRSIEVY